ncbi:MAG: outer membrane lipoprotein carrier protein LolA [Weeksellaceae bacterium]|nr:outer membrane lipoprotein carrier protein LolA [Weeksellaceae bacterium]
MKTVIYALMGILFMAPMQAQSSAEAKRILDEVSQAYKQRSSFHMKFDSELHNAKTNTKDRFDGQVYVRGERYNLSVPKMDIRQIYDGKKLHTVSADQKEVTVTTPEASGDELFTPTKVFEMYRKGYNLSVDKTAVVNGRNLTFVKLTPTTAGSVKHVLVGIDRVKKELVQLIEVNQNNTTTTITVKEQIANVVVPNSLLTFNKSQYPGYYVTEM